ncbi:succinate-semialdehyde dehydrogenase, mitochondrial-like isoform X2 [Cherax quadricarinatus]|uniref:succinate-semialdehyde dehydrogenase, mitochondrial-like isoform X2 n=1 Tax=Cherax quadricarinatus TaxID=27406 RepID=UPI00387EA071
MSLQELLTKAYIGGSWRAGRGGTFPVYDPATGEEITRVADCTVEDLDEAIEAASEAYSSWRHTTVKQRATLLHKIQVALLDNKDTIATTLTRENGKPKAEAAGEVMFAASFFEWFAEETRRQYGETIPSAAATKRMITVRQPVGVAAVITPWNFPIAMLARKVSAALAAGCTCVIKPAEDTPLVALAFAKVCESVGVPVGVVNVVPCSRGRVQQIGSRLCESPKVHILSFTGSTAVGKWLYSRCGSTLKKVSLELGGDAPFIVFPSANMDTAIAGTMVCKFRNTGQLDKMVRETVSAGAQVVRGGASQGGLYYAPTLLTGVTPDMALAKNEIFGPVAPIIKFSTEEEVVSLANTTDRGLAGYFYSNDLSQVWRVAEALEVGMVGVNEGLLSTCEAPFGGFKHSGLGKEGSKHGLDEYSNLKYICFGV